jgi:hypothetical protein
VKVFILAAFFQVAVAKRRGLSGGNSNPSILCDLCDLCVKCLSTGGFF